MTDFCPCNSNKTYQHCCQPIHQDHQLAIHPEQLMRARYSAHVLGDIEFIINTYHPSCQAQKHRAAIEKSVKSQWIELQVINTEIQADQAQGFVEFKAFYLEDNNKQCLHENSRFVKEKINNLDLWFYIDGTYPEMKKIGRNDPCPCNSGKKYKKCCGK